MKTIGIFYFSGTGNTRIVAELLRDAFIKQNYQVDLTRIEDVMNGLATFDPAKYDMIGFGSQVIGYGVPNLVKDFLKKLPEGQHQKAFIFRLAGGVAPINYNVSKYMIRVLKAKGYDVFHERLFSLGSNWIKRFSDPVVQQLYRSTIEKVDQMGLELIEGRERFYQTGFWMRLGMGIVSFFSGQFFRLTGLDYRVSSSCENCGLCARNCPSKNITIKNGKPSFGLNCSCCMRCLYNCPKQAIQLRNLSFFAVEGGYNIKKTLEHPLTDGETICEQPPFFNRYTTDIDF
jgi:ferredoxin